MSDRVAFEMKLVQDKTGQTFQAKVCIPEMRSQYNEHVKRNLTSWYCGYSVKIGARRGRHGEVGGSTWLQSLLLAADAVRRELPDDNGVNWKNEDGEESWVIFPRLVPIGWGHEVFLKALDACNQLEQRATDSVVRKRDGGQSARRTRRAAKST